MVWARIALVSGLLLLLAAFAVGTEQQRSTVVDGQTLRCGPAIPASWLVSGTPAGAPAACGSVIQQSRWVLGTAMGVGGLLVLVGWTAPRSRTEDVPGQPIHA